MQELQRAFKNPTANLGLIFSEAGRRAGAVVGLSSAPDLSAHVATALRPASAELGKLAAEYGRCVEAALVRHGRAVVDEQQLLQRLADAAIDAYTTAAVLSRASRAVRTGASSADDEVRLAEAWADEALARAPRLLSDTRDARALRAQVRLNELGALVAAHGGTPAPGVLGL